MLVWKSCLLVAGVVALCISAVLPASAAEAKPSKAWVYIGTYTGAKSKGIYRLEMDLATGKLSEPELAGETGNPSFLALHPTRRFLYAVSEGGGSGQVKSFAIDAKTGNLSPLNAQPSKGAGPCHMVVDRRGKNLLVANYSGGSVAVVPILDDGSLGEPTGFAQHKGSGVNPARQKEPHAHSINLDASNHFAFVADLGLDQVLVYRFDPARGTITPNDPPFVTVAPGAGPRHFAFHPNGKFAYVINEMGNTVTFLTYDSEKGVLKAGQSITTLPEGTNPLAVNNSTAEVVVHPSGKFLYGSNRGHNSIAIYKIDPKTGELTAVGHQGMGIKTPRNFNIDPTGKFMIVANQDGNNLLVFKIDQKTGELTPTGQKIEVGAPVCVKFLVQ